MRTTRRKAARWIAIVLVATIGSAVLVDTISGALDVICGTTHKTAFCPGK